MGLISLPIMLRYGYDRRLASGVIAASGTLAQIIPPSLVLIVLADQLGRSVGDMYEGALIPGLVLTGIYMLYILFMSIVAPEIDAGAAARGAHARLRGYVSHPCADHRRGNQLWRARLSRTVCRRQRRYLGRHHRRRLHLCRGDRRPGAEIQRDVATGAAGDHRADPAAGADLPGARHDLPRHRDADRGRRHGRRRRADHGCGQGTAHARRRQAGARLDDAAVRLSSCSS